MTESRANVVLVRVGSVIPRHWTQYLNIVRSPLVPHITTSCTAGPWKDGEGVTVSWANVELMRDGFVMPGH